MSRTLFMPHAVLPVAAALALCLSPGAVLAESAPAPAPQDFAYGFAVTVPEDGALYKLDLPDACLTLAVDPQMRDLAVFNSEGALLPAAPYYPSATLKTERVPAQLTTVLWKVDEAEDAAKAAGLAPGAVIIVDKDRLAAMPLEEARQNQIIPAAYLARLPEKDLTLAGLSVRWKADQLTQMVRVRVECAADLSADNWQLLADGPLAQVLSGSGPALESVRFALPGVSAGQYLKISFPELKTAPELLSVDADVQRTEMPALNSLNTVLKPLDLKAAAPEQDLAAVFEIDLSARKWTDSLALTPASPIIWRGASLLGRDNDAQDWRLLHTFDLFKITGNSAAGENSVTNGALVVQAELPRFLRIAIPAGARGKADLNVRLLYVQPGLVFQAQPPAPYTLACGSGTARLSPDIDQELLALSGAAQAQVAKDRHTLGGEAALIIPTPEQPVDKMRLALWGVLALGAAALGGMIFTLHRNMRK